MNVSLSEAFARYGAKLRNPQWSVSAWTPDGALVVSLWTHHIRRNGPPDTMEFEDRLDRWAGPGNKELRKNLLLALQKESPVRLVLVRTVETGRVQAGQDASKSPTTYAARDDLIGKVTHADDASFVIQFRKQDVSNLDERD
jgi:hypothetical protein